MVEQGTVDVEKVTKNGDIIRTTFSLGIWNLMRSKKETGDTRKGWTVSYGAAPRTAKAPVGKGVPPALIPAPILEAANKAAGIESPAPGTALPAPPASNVPSNDLTQIPNLGAKVAELLNGIGIRTYGELAAAAPASINKMLADAKPALTAKQAQVPGWIAKAKELSA